MDFFPPVVDDPFLYGQIAAANALSDVYAMGGKPTLAMNLLCYPTCLPLETVREILAGGAEKVKEAGAVLAGGHTIEDDEPKYGLCVTGFCHPDKILTNSGAKPGDVLVLTKPLGTGILTTAATAELVSAEDFHIASASMAELNRNALEALDGLTVHACTDVTGFGLLGHACEMAEGSHISLELYSENLPVLPGAESLAQMGVIPAGAYRNAEYVREKTLTVSGIPQHLTDIMADPQTSGGLLAALPEHDAEIYLSRLEAFTPWARLVGRAVSVGRNILTIK